MEAIVLAGGFGTRLTRVVSDVPKPMAPVAGKPFLEFILADLAEKGMNRVVLAVGYKRECIMQHFGDSFMNMKIIYSQEDTPLYTGGAIKKALSYCRNKEVFVINGDTFFDVPLKVMADDYRQNSAQLSIAVKEMHDFDRYGTVRFGADGWISGFEEKQVKDYGYINGGIYLIAANLLKDYPDIFSFEKQVLETDFCKYRMRAYSSKGYFIDIGIPEDYDKAQKDFA